MTNERFEQLRQLVDDGICSHETEELFKEVEYLREREDRRERVCRTTSGADLEKLATLNPVVHAVLRSVMFARSEADAMANAAILLAERADAYQKIAEKLLSVQAPEPIVLRDLKAESFVGPPECGSINGHCTPEKGHVGAHKLGDLAASDLIQKMNIKCLVTGQYCALDGGCQCSNCEAAERMAAPELQSFVRETKADCARKAEQLSERAWIGPPDCGSITGKCTPENASERYQRKGI